MLIGVSFLVFGLAQFIDFLIVKQTLIQLPDLLNQNLGLFKSTLDGLAEVVTSLLGIEITALAIIVQLAANKYSSKIMELFLENKVNITILFIFVIASVNTILIVSFIQPEFDGTFTHPFSVTLTLAFAILSITLIIPHFNYVFYLLRPENFLLFVETRSRKTLESFTKQSYRFRNEDIEQLKARINFIGDVASNCVVNGDKAVALLCVGSLKQVFIDYEHFKKDLPEEWFLLTGNESTDPDFSGFSPYVLEKIEKRKLLIETKIFKIYELLFENSRRDLRDVSTGILLNTQMIALDAIQRNDEDLIRGIFQFFNTFMRIAIREKDPKAIFTTLEHYRLVAEKLLEHNPKLVEEISFYFKYYGQEAIKNHILFILETAAYDLCLINEKAYLLGVSNQNELLDIFLTLDQRIDDNPEKDKESKEELSLMGVRVIQSRLAAFYLINNDEKNARLIYEDMKVEPLGRINKISQMINNTKREEFWEITARGINFYYLPPDRKEALKKFFSWFDEIT